MMSADPLSERFAAGYQETWAREWTATSQTRKASLWARKTNRVFRMLTSAKLSCARQNAERSEDAR